MAEKCLIYLYDPQEKMKRKNNYVGKQTNSAQNFMFFGRERLSKLWCNKKLKKYERQIKERFSKML